MKKSIPTLPHTKTQKIKKTQPTVAKYCLDFLYTQEGITNDHNLTLFFGLIVEFFEGLVSPSSKIVCSGSSLCVWTIVCICKGISDSYLESEEGYLLLLHSTVFYQSSLSLVVLPCSWHKPGSRVASVVTTMSWLLCIIDIRIWLQYIIRLTSFLPLRHWGQQFMNLVTPPTDLLAVTFHV